MTARLSHHPAAFEIQTPCLGAAAKHADEASVSPRLRRGRLFVLMWAAVYPLALSVGEALHAVLPPAAPRWSVVLITSGVLVAAMMFLIAPAITRLFAPWL